jgi:hypothetical protein
MDGMMRRWVVEWMGWWMEGWMDVSMFGLIGGLMDV